MRVPRSSATLRPSFALRLWGAFAVGAGTGACFDGADALGLPCELDRDCGVDQRCLDGVCTNKSDDTPPETCGDGIVQSGVGEECDDGNDVEDDGCTNDCKLPVCGDGIVQPGAGEECDDGNDDNDDECTNACTLPACGNGTLDPGEECDDGNTVDDDGCTNACKLPACGDGIVQTGEECDDGNDVDDATCMADCTLVWLFDDAEDPLAFGNWTQVNFPTAQTDPKTAWTRVENAQFAHAGGAAYHLPPQEGIAMASGGVRLVSPPLDLSNAGGTSGTVELRFFHNFDFDPCPMTNTGDGGRIEVSTDGGTTWTPVTPVVPAGGYPGTLAQTCDMLNQEPNPLGWMNPAFVGEQTSWQEVRVDLSAFAGQTIRIALSAGFDCTNCTDNDTGIWYVDDIVVARPL